MILAVGEALIDFVPGRSEGGREAFMPVPGGCPYNTVISAARLGVTAGFLGRLSSDLFGDQLITNLEQNHVHTKHVIRADQPTTLAFVRRDAAGNARYAFYMTNSADRSLSDEDIPTPLPSSVRALMYGSISTVLEPGASTIGRLVEREAGQRVLSFDPNVRESLITDWDAYREHFERLASHSTIVKISDADLQSIYPQKSLEEGVSTLLSGGASLVVLTRGPKGSSAHTAGQDASVSAVNTTVSDTIGAGDSFHGALLAWLEDRELLSVDAIPALSEEQLGEMLQFASTVSAITCSREGADPPYREDLPAELR
jgi:fructokinase